MQLDAMLERCRSLEERSAALYRSYAAASRADPPLCALWTELARDEEAHARSIALARARADATTRWRIALDGWEEALTEVEDRLAAAEQVGGEAPTHRLLAAALDLEMSELEAMRRVLLAVCSEPSDAPEDHAVRLADAAERLSDDPHVRLQTALLRARTRLTQTA
jgi:hypothetical protein